MDKNYQTKILDLIRTDLITINGGKNNLKIVTILMALLFGGLGFLFSPLMGLYVPLVISTFFVPMLFQNEMKYHSEKMFAILPIERKDLVRSRFIMSIVLYLVCAAVFYLLMLISLKLKPYYMMYGEDASNMDIIRLLAQNTDGSMTELGIFNLLYFLAFSFGFMLISGNLRKYFKDSKAFDATLSGGLKKAKKRDYYYAFIVFAVITVIVLGITDVLPVRNAVVPFLQLFIQLAQIANGFLLGAVFVTVAVFSTIYKYICAMLEYDEKEL
ncbi:MAG: ABC-2 transporter permease [Ruminococcus sp.]|nr:ABC-2 transporter permease [Ruminococcus sp.]